MSLEWSEEWPKDVINISSREVESQTFSGPRTTFAPNVPETSRNLNRSLIMTDIYLLFLHFSWDLCLVILRHNSLWIIISVTRQMILLIFTISNGLKRVIYTSQRLYNERDPDSDVFVWVSKVITTDCLLKWIDVLGFLCFIKKEKLTD